MYSSFLYWSLFINSLLKLYYFLFAFRDISVYYKRALDTRWVYIIYYKHFLFEGHIIVGLLNIVHKNRRPPLCVVVGERSIYTIG